MFVKYESSGTLQPCLIVSKRHGRILGYLEIEAPHVVNLLSSDVVVLVPTSILGLKKGVPPPAKSRCNNQPGHRDVPGY